jgi:hypothetical protein
MAPGEAEEAVVEDSQALEEEVLEVEDLLEIGRKV